MADRKRTESPVVLSYLQLRRIVGFVGLLLPFVLGLGMWAQGQAEVGNSISIYYYTDLRNLFVGSLCTIGVFLIACKGYDRRDEIAGYLAGFCAIGVGLCHTAPDGCPIPLTTQILSVFHHVFAAVLFLTLAYFCLFLFRETDPGGQPTAQKLQRNVVYLVCGIAILGSILAIVMVSLLNHVDLFVCQYPNPIRIFWFESVAVVSFGVAWLVKGETILKDQPPAL
jgi:hypothetical protein